MNIDIRIENLSNIKKLLASVEELTAKVSQDIIREAADISSSVSALVDEPTIGACKPVVNNDPSTGINPEKTIKAAPPQDLGSPVDFPGKHPQSESLGTALKPCRESGFSDQPVGPAIDRPSKSPVDKLTEEKCKPLTIIPVAINDPSVGIESYTNIYPEKTIKAAPPQDLGSPVDFPAGPGLISYTVCIPKNRGLNMA